VRSRPTLLVQLAPEGRPFTPPETSRGGRAPASRSRSPSGRGADAVEPYTAFPYFAGFLSNVALHPGEQKEMVLPWYKEEPAAFVDSIIIPQMGSFTIAMAGPKRGL